MTVREREGARQRGGADRPARPGAGILWPLTATAAVLTVVGFPRELGWAGDLAAAFRPHYAVVGAACLTGMAVARRWAGVLVATGVVAVNVGVVAPLWVEEPAPAAPGAPALTVLWHNVFGVDERRAAELVEAIDAADADIVILAQVDTALAAALRRSDVLPHDVLDAADGRILLLSTVPVARVRTVGSLPAGSRDTAVTLEAEVAPRRSVAILGIHTQSPRTPRTRAARDAELAVVASWADAQEGATVVVGDLNVPPWSRQLRDLASAGGLIDSTRGHGLQPTWPARLGPAGVPIDHALHSPDLTTVARSTGRAVSAAHRSLRVTLAPADPASMQPASVSRAHPAGGTHPRSSR